MNSQTTRKKFIGASLFAGGGIAELNLSNYVNFVVSNEIIKNRAEMHNFLHPNAGMICGDITIPSIKETIIKSCKREGVNFIMATPPCQGVSLIGKNKRNDQFLKDQRNFLIFHALEIIDKVSPEVVVIENVDRFIKMRFPYNNEMHNIEEILADKYKGIYTIASNIYNAADYGTPQTRKRLIIVLYKSNIKFTTPTKIEKQITVREAIGDLPSLESGETSCLKHHHARKHTADHVLFMQHTPTGKSAFQNLEYFPKKKNGEKITGYPYTYKRIDWDKPAPTITMRNDTISSTHSVHPGRLLKNGLYSDARVLTLRELFILSSINPDIDLPDYISENQIRYMIGEAVPPKLMESIVKSITRI